MANYQYKSKKRPTIDEEELQKKLRLSLIGIIVTIFVLGISVTFLGPKIGSLFGLISVNRNDNGFGDNLAPVAPIFAHSPTHTNKKELKLDGISEPGATVKLFLNGPQKDTTIADQNGEFTFANLPLIEGKNTIFAKAVDKENNESDKSDVLTITLDTKKPEIDIEEPKKDSVVRNLDGRISVVGKLNEKAEVKVNNRTAIVKPDLSFEAILGVEEGNIEIKIQAKDQAGNVKEEKLTVQYVKGS